MKKRCLVLLLAGLAARDVVADHACCFPGGECVSVGDEPECNGLGGIFLADADCAADACAPAACCFDTSCSTADAFACISAGREYAGAGTTCLDDPCDAGVGACCLAGGGCDDLSPEGCDDMGGTWLGAGTSCDAGDCDTGACCRPGWCASDVRFLCIAAGDVFVPDGDCADSGCDLENDCPADSVYAQRRQGPEGFTAYVSEQGAGIERWDRYQGVAGTIDGLRWWGLDLAFDGEVFSECEETVDEFRVTFADDDAGSLGFPVCSYTLTVERTPTGIFYGASELLEYEVTLPTPCVLPTGWVSIVGLGDPDCWFLWMGATEGDGVSQCSGCAALEELDDLSFCLIGTIGGIFGACCDLSTAGCVDGVEITECVAIDQRFTPDVQCLDLDPPCVPTTGACCFDDGAFCTITLPVDCVDRGGEWIGPDTDCIQCPVIGLCCLADGTCVFLEQADCLGENGTWLGSSGKCEECPAAPTCPRPSLLAQDADGPDDFTALTSEASAGLQRSEDFAGVAGAIEAITWWGVDLDNIEGTNAFVECEEPDPTFEISLHVDAAGAPGAVVCSYTLEATRTPLGINYLGTELNEYRAVLPEPCVLVNGWLSIVGLGDEECWFLWLSAGIGGSWCDGCSPSSQDLDLAMCLEGTAGGVLGACCDDASGSCKESVDIVDCVGEGLRFAPGASCEEIDPACGVVIGACCFETATCSIETEQQCVELGGAWSGPTSVCSQCPCLTPCPAGADPEGEPTCFDDSLDEFNGGCDLEEPVFSPITLGQMICGESGAFALGAETAVDYDWYAIDVSRPLELRWSVDAEFPVVAGIVDGNAGCPGSVLTSDLAGSCEPLVLTAKVDPGTYWLVVQPAFPTDETICGVRYTARVTTPCPADTNGDGVVDVDDLVNVILAWGSADAATDVNMDGVVDVDDLLEVILSWGECGGVMSD